MDIKDIEHIVRILRESDVAEFELEQEGTRLKLVRGPQGFVVASGSQPQLGYLGVAPATALPVVSPENDDTAAFVKVESPIVGTFYRRPSPDAEPFVKEKDHVKKGDTLCIVEAMKLMNEIEAPCSGTIERVLLNDGQVVEYGEVLYLIKPDL